MGDARRPRRGHRDDECRGFSGSSQGAEHHDSHIALVRGRCACALGWDTVVIMAVAKRTEAASMRSWTFLTNHAHVLLSLAADPDMRLRDIATRVGITERAAQIIVSDLDAAGYVVKERIGRRNRYTLVADQHFRHPAEAGHSVDELVRIFT
jgi:hypothetical protein